MAALPLIPKMGETGDGRGVRPGQMSVFWADGFMSHGNFSWNQLAFQLSKRDAAGSGEVYRQQVGFN